MRLNYPCRFALTPSLLALALTAPLAAETLEEPIHEAKVVGPIVGHASYHDVSPPLSEMGEQTRAFPPGFEVEIPLPKSPRQRPPNRVTAPDPLRQTEQRPILEAGTTPLPSLNFDGLTNLDFVLPPDTVGDVGVDFYVQWVNLSFAIYAKATGAIADGPFSGNSLFAGFGGACPGGASDSSACACQVNNDGDPIVLFDHLAERWLMTQFSIVQGVQCVALSQTRDPRGTYDRWAFEVTPGGQNDYPKMGLMPDAYYLSTRDFPFNVGDFAGFAAFDRAEMLAGNPAAGFVKFGLPCDQGNNNCPDGVQPPHLEGPAPVVTPPGIFTKMWDDDWEGPFAGAGGVDGYRMWELDFDPVTLGNSIFVELPMVPAGADFNANMCGGSRHCIPEPEVGGPCVFFPFEFDCEFLDAISFAQMYRAQFRNWGSYNSLLISTTVDATGTDVAGVRWAELRDDGAGGAWTLFQDGTYAPADGENRWMGSIAMDTDGNMALGYSVASTATFPSIRYVTREAGDAAGTFPGGEVEAIAGSGSQTNSSHRWGDYSSMSVDPVDDCTFWYTQEYIAATGGAPWRTRITSFKIPGCSATRLLVDPGNHGFGAIQVGNTSAAVTIGIENDGTDPINVTDIVLSNSTDFTLNLSPAVAPCGGTAFLLPGSTTCNVEAEFNPQSQALFAATVDVTTDDPGASGSVALDGTGFNPCPHNATEVVTNVAPENGTLDVFACLTIDVMTFHLGPTGTATLTAGSSTSFGNDVVIEGELTVNDDPSLALP